MTVKELRAIIENLPAEMEVILQKDSAGNGYSPLWTADSDNIYVPDGAYSGIAYLVDLNAEDHCLEPDEWDRLKLKPRALVLAPIN